MTSPRDGRATTIRGRGNNSVGGANPFGSTGSTGGSTGALASGSASGSRSRGGAGITGGGAMAATRNFGARLAGIEARLSTMEMGARAGQISFTSMLDGDLTVTDLLGEVKMKIGMQSDGKPGVTYTQGAAPPMPSAPSVSARQLYIVIGWDGQFADPEQPRPSDLARVDVHVSTEADYEPSGATAVASLFSESVCIVPADIEDHWVRLVAVSLGDVPSPATAAVLVRPLPADKIAAESIAAVHLASEILLSSTIVAGDPTGAHMELNATGLRMVREDQTPTVVFSADEGNALITGSIQTALRSSGKSRIVFNPFPERDWNEIRFYAPNDENFSSLFASRDRNGKNGAIALQGPYSEGDPFVLSVNLGEDNLLAGVFNTTSTADPDGTAPFSDGLLASPAQTALVGGGGPFIVHNYKRATPTSAPGPNGSQDPFIAFTNNPTSAFNGLSVLEFHEVEDVAGYRWGTIRNSGNDLMFKFGDGPFARFAFKDYDNTQGAGYVGYVPIATAGLADLSSESSKTDITDLDEHVDPLAVVTAVKPIRFRRRGSEAGTEDRTMWLPDPIPPEAPPEVLAQLDDDLAAAREHKTDDGRIPVPLGKRPPRHPPQYGLIAEHLAPLAPDAIVPASDGVTPMLDHGSLIGLLWGAVGKLSGKVDDLTQRIQGAA